MRKEFSSGKRLRFNRKRQWVSPFFDNVSMLTCGPNVSDETWGVLRDALIKSEPTPQK